MPVEQTLRQLVMSDAKVIEHVAGRVRFSRLQDNETMPAISIGRVGGRSYHDLAGDHGNRKAWFQMDIWGEENELAKVIEIRDSLTKKLNGFRDGGTIQLITVDPAGGPEFDEPSRHSREMLQLEVHYIDL